VDVLHLEGRGVMSALAKVYAERVHIDRSGYDRHGRYWGVGGKLYRVTAEGPEGDELDTHVRAASSKAAKDQVKQELLVKLNRQTELSKRHAMPDFQWTRPSLPPGTSRG
jgi:hypothetical protein